MHDDDTLERDPVLAGEWRRQEAARGAAASSAAAAGDDPSPDTGYVRLFGLLAAMPDLDPPAQLTTRITLAVRRRVDAARQVEAFARALRRGLWVPVAGAVSVAAIHVGIHDLAAAFSGAGWLRLPALALLLGVLPLRSRRDPAGPHPHFE